MRHSTRASPSLSPIRYRSAVLSSPGLLTRFPGAKIVFLILRHQLTTVQAVLTEEEGTISQNMLRWAEGIARESIVLVEGVLQEPDGHTEVKSATVHKVEIKVEKVYLHRGHLQQSVIIFANCSLGHCQLFIVAHPSSSLPFQVEQVSRPAQLTHASVGDQTRYNNRVLDLRVSSQNVPQRLLY
jgi:aspartyl/asparaginyl-tRNA synthetase